MAHFKIEHENDKKTWSSNRKQSQHNHTIKTVAVKAIVDHTWIAGDTDTRNKNNNNRKQFWFECETKRKQIKFHRKPNDFPCQSHWFGRSAVQLFENNCIYDHHNQLLFIWFVFFSLALCCRFTIDLSLPVSVCLSLCAFHPHNGFVCRNSSLSCLCVCVGFEGIRTNNLAVYTRLGLCIKVINFMNRALNIEREENFPFLLFTCVQLNECICMHTDDNVAVIYDRRDTFTRTVCETERERARRNGLPL